LSAHQLLLLGAAEAPNYVLVEETITFTDGAPSVEVDLADSVTLTEAMSLELPLSDSVTLSDALSISPLVSDDFLLIDTAQRVQDETSLDGVSLPHVQIIEIQEPSIIKDLPIMDALPYRKQLGKHGRSIRLEGWTDSLSVLETLRGYDDGEKHLLILPTGDSLQVHVTDVLTPEAVENYKTYDYTLVMVETVD
jgi:hypothetical protein